LDKVINKNLPLPKIVLAMKLFSTFLTILLSLQFIFAQNVAKKPLNHDAYRIWKRIEKTQLSNDGRWTIYQLSPTENDATLVLYDNDKALETAFARGSEAQISADNQWLVFKIKPFYDTLKAQRRRKVKDNDLPKDTLCIYQLLDKKLVKIPNVKSYKMPEKWAGALAFLREAEKEKKEDKKAEKKDSTATKTAAKKKKEENKDNGFKLTVRDLKAGVETNFDYVKEYIFAEEGKKMALVSSGNDSTMKAGVYYINVENAKSQPVLTAKKGNFKNITLSKSGKYLGFVADIDTTKARIRPFGLYHFEEGNTEAKQVFAANNMLLPKEWLISENANLTYNKNENRLIFGIAPPPMLQDTTLLSEEIVNVEVWHYEEPKLYTQQVNNLEDYKKRSYSAVYDIISNNVNLIVQDDSSKIVRFDKDYNFDNILIMSDLDYRKESSWTGQIKQDVFLKNLKTGKIQKIAEGTAGNFRLSPFGKYVFWYSRNDSNWLAYHVENQRLINLTKGLKVSFYDELNDVPETPSDYGNAGWLKDDEAFLVYDRYDIWKIDPMNLSSAANLSKSRSDKKNYRYINLDKEKNYIETAQPLLLQYVNEDTKGEGYAYFDLKTNQLRSAYFQPDMALTSQVIKAKNANTLLFTKENFKTFPDLYLVKNQDFTKANRISNANPQQANYLWGNAELYTWTDLNGNRLTGMLFKPEGFDAKKKYPMIVNYYERSSQSLNSYRVPDANRSNINYSFYVSRGYIVFNPDVPYRIGYPGESALSAVMSGVTSLIEKGFVDAQHIGIQGHSWGGYQTAYIVTKTNLFKCAEAGAPVANMTSAYGGIRWESGLVREFQYEHGQSRIGGTLWEYPMRYLENSPLFFADKIQTPLLILHNDKDGAVPYYQGIELFTAMRRLNKPAWLLNYNEEPHWPLKWQNRYDFNIRMQQFFDYYLKGDPMPSWMQRGVPAVEKGIKQGYDLDKK
jgi:dipeptidyl aminopeptidase/acylaminoacyl peptidase